VDGFMPGALVSQDDGERIDGKEKLGELDHGIFLQVLIFSLLKKNFFLSKCFVVARLRMTTGVRKNTGW
jgi:hypothetical protein